MLTKLQAEKVSLRETNIWEKSVGLAEEVRSSAGNEEEKVFGARFSRQENSHLRKKQYRHLRLIFSWRKEKKIVRLFEAIRWLVLRPWDKSNAKGIRKWTKRDINPRS